MYGSAWRVMIHALDRRTSKKPASPSHHESVWRRRTARRLAASSEYRVMNARRVSSRGKWRRGDVDAQHVPEPGVLADTLVHHLFAHAAATDVPDARPHLEVVVLELAPDTDDFEALRFVGIGEECVGHAQSFSDGEFAASAGLERRSFVHNLRGVRIR